MPDYATASRTKDHFQGRLLGEHPEIVSIAPRLRLDAQGQPTADAVIVIGVKTINPLRLGPLPVITPQGAEDQTQSVDVVVDDEGEIVPMDSRKL